MALYGVAMPVVVIWKKAIQDRMPKVETGSELGAHSSSSRAVQRFSRI